MQCRYGKLICRRYRVNVASLIDSWRLFSVLAQLLDVVIWLIIIDAVLSWVMAPDAFPKSLTTAMLEPLYKPIRSLVSFGGGMDFSPIILIVVLNVIQAFVR